MPRVTLTATITSGQSVSSAVDLSLGTAAFIHMPAAWTPALLSLLISPDNVTFNDLVDETAREITFNVIPGTVIQGSRVPALAGWLKFRSGSRTGAVIQTGSRIFTLTVDT
jgi:hypothetical protein